VLVGKNGAGKSTLMDIPVLIGEILKDRDVSDAFFKATDSHARPRADAPQELIYNGQGDWFSFALELELPLEVRERIHQARERIPTQKLRAALESNPERIYTTMRYELGVSIEEGALIISDESLLLLPADKSLLDESLEGSLWGSRVVEDDINTIRVLIQRGRNGQVRYKGEVRKFGKSQDPLRLQLKPTAPALASIPMDENQFVATQWLNDFLTEDAYLYNPQMDAMRSASIPPGKDWKVATDASTLAWSIFQLKKDPDSFEEWIDHARNVLPLLTDIEPKRREDDGLAYYRVHYGDGRIVNNSGLSDGTLSVLALTILPFIENTPQLLTIEEPENGIHPKAIEAVLEALDAMEHTQVWVTTHSPIAVAVTPLEQLLCLNQTHESGVVVTAGTQHPQLKSWKGTPSLATLHSAGVL
jgi:energy-coupling factor transporter ATP-binding protein EcfA2